MAIQPWVPSQFSWLYDALVGQSWPQADEDALRRDAQHYVDAIVQLLALDRGNAGVARLAGYSVQAISAEAFAQYFQQYTADDNAPFGQQVRQAQHLAQALLEFADETEYTKLSMNIQLVIVAIQLAWAIAAAFFTLGTSLEEGALAVSVGRITVRELALRLLQGVLTMEFPDLITQTYMLADGHESSWDWGKTVPNVAMGLLAGGLGELGGHYLPKVFPFMADGAANALWQKGARLAVRFVEGGTNMVVSSLITQGGTDAFYALTGQSDKVRPITFGDVLHSFVVGGWLGTVFEIPKTFGGGGPPPGPGDPPSTPTDPLSGIFGPNEEPLGVAVGPNGKASVYVGRTNDGTPIVRDANGQPPSDAPDLAGHVILTKGQDGSALTYHVGHDGTVQPAALERRPDGSVVARDAGGNVLGVYGPDPATGPAAAPGAVVEGGVAVVDPSAPPEPAAAEPAAAAEAPATPVNEPTVGPQPAEATVVTAAADEPAPTTQVASGAPEPAQLPFGTAQAEQSASPVEAAQIRPSSDLLATRSPGLGAEPRVASSDIAKELAVEQTTKAQGPTSVARLLAGEDLAMTGAEDSGLVTAEATPQGVESPARNDTTTPASSSGPAEPPRGAGGTAGGGRWSSVPLEPVGGDGVSAVDYLAGWAPDAASSIADRLANHDLAGAGAHSGTAANIGDSFRGDAHPERDLADQRVRDQYVKDVRDEVYLNYRLIAPEGVRFDIERFIEENGEALVFQLPGGHGDVHVAVGEAEAGSVASFRERADGVGYDVTVSAHARVDDVARAVAHELAEIRHALDYGTDYDTAHERPTELTPHLDGRFAELRVLLNRIDRATFSPHRARELEGLHDGLGDLSRTIGLAGDDGRPVAGTARDLLAGRDPLLARRLELHEGRLLEEHPRFDARLPEAGFIAHKDAFLGDLRHQLSGEHVDAVLGAQELALGGRWHQELARRIFDPVFESGKPSAYRMLPAAAREGLFRALDPINRALENPNLTESERTAALRTAITRMENSSSFRGQAGSAFDHFDFNAMRENAGQAGEMGIGVLDHFTGRVTLSHEIPGIEGREVSLVDLARLLDRANRGARQNALSLEHVLVIREPFPARDQVALRSRLDVLSRPRPQYRQAAAGHTPRPGLDPAVAGGQIIEVGVGRGGFGAEMTPEEGRAGSVIFQTELPDNGWDRRRNLDILDPAPMTEAGSVVVFGDLLTHGDLLARDGNGGVARMYINNVSAEYNDAQYLAAARTLSSMMREGGTVEVRWDTRPWQDVDGQLKPRGHIEGPILGEALDEAGEWQIRVETEALDPAGSEYLFTPDAGLSTRISVDRILLAGDPRPEFRTVITFLRRVG